MNRLDELQVLRTRIDDEIARETLKQRRIRAARSAMPALLDGPEAIITAVTDTLGIDPAQIPGRRQTKEYSIARSLICWIALETGLTTREAAPLIGRSPKNTAYYRDRVENDPELLERARGILDQLSDLRIGAAS